jgi:WD40 repeat protein
LRAFQAADEQDFFGREAITKKLLQRMSEDGDFGRFLAIVGPSGSGKSSLVKAGLIPALWRGELPSSERWYVVDMIPGSRPLDELEVALTRITSDQSERLNEHLRRDSHGLIRLSKIILPDDGSELVIVIDQFEELFSLVEEEQERSHFLDSLYAAVTDPRSRVRVVITLRADFYDRPLNYADFGQLVQNRTETVLPLSAEELERAIVQPAKRVGLDFEEGLVPAIIQDVHYQPGALPLLQYALTELFDERTNRTMTQEAYKVIGGTIGALATRAEEIYGDLDEDSQESTRQMFLRLVTLGEGVEDTRRRVERSEIMAIVGEEGRDAMDELIDNFAAYRLLSLDNDPTTRSPTIEVAHEALLREWDRLRVWLDESRVDIRLERQLAASAEQWLDGGRDPSFLLRGTRLAQFENWSQHSSLVLTAEEWEFLRDSSQSAVDEEREKDAQVERELAAAQTIRRRAVYLTIALIATAVLAIAAITFARNATNNAARAEAAEESALRQASIGLAALAEAELGGINKERGVLLALEALEHYPYTPQAAGALARSVEEFRAFRSLDASSSVGELIMVATWSPDGTRVAAGSNASPNSIIIWDAATGSELLAVDTHANHCEASRVLLRDLAWSPTGDRLAAAAQNADSGQPCGVVVIDTSTGDELFVLDGYETAARSQDWSPDGNLMVTGHEDGSLRMWQVTSDRERSILTGHSEAIYDAVFSPNGQRIASASEDGTVKLWDADTGVELMVFEGHVGSVRSIDWSPDGKRFVTGGSDGLPRVWEAQSGETVFVLPGHTDEIAIVNWSTDGRRIASQSYDATVNVWDAATGGLIFQITNAAPDPDTKRGFVEFSPDGKWILTGGSRVIGVLLWDATTSVPKLFGHSFGQEWGAWSPDGSLIATSGTDGSARLWDAQSGEQLEVFDHGSFWGDWSPDGTRLVTADGVIAKALSVWDVTTGKLLFSLSVPDDEHGAHQFLTMDWSPDGRYIAAADFRPFSPQAVFVWDVETRELVSAFFPDDLCMQGWPRWSPDSTRIASGCIFVESGTNTPARIWDVATGVEVLRLESEHGWTYRTVWSPDGSQILVTYENGVARIWDATDGAPRLTFTGHQGPVDGAWSQDGTLIASTDYADQLVKIWKSETGEELWSFSVAGAPLTIGWSPDGAHVIVTGDGLTEPVIKRVWQTTEELIDYAYQCCVYRELSAEEREQFGLPPAEDLARD